MMMIPFLILLMVMFVLGLFSIILAIGVLTPTEHRHQH